MDSAETDLLLAALDVVELHGMGAPHLVILLEVQLAALLVALVEVLSVSVCVVVMQAVPTPQDWCLHALVRSMAALGDYHEARLLPPTSVSGKVESWEAMAPLSPFFNSSNIIAILKQFQSKTIVTWQLNKKDIVSRKIQINANNETIQQQYCNVYH